MIPIAVVLLVLVAALTLLVGLNSAQPVAVDGYGNLDLALFGLTIPVNEFGLFCCGAVAMLALVIALVLLRGGLRRQRAARRKERELLKAASGQAAASIDRKPRSKRVLPGRAGEASAEAKAASTPGSGTRGSSTAALRTSTDSSLPETGETSETSETGGAGGTGAAGTTQH